MEVEVGAGAASQVGVSQVGAAQGGASQVRASQALVNYDAPSIHLLQPATIDFLPAPREGFSVYVCKVNVKDIAFPDEIYAVKYIKQGDGIMNVEQLAMHEATNIPFQHMGTSSHL